jgi:hypothetical protein
MQSHTIPSAEISIALLSWINDQLRETVVQREQQRLRYWDEWRHNAVTVLAAGLSCLCVLVLQRWS